MDHDSKRQQAAAKPAADRRVSAWQRQVPVSGDEGRLQRAGNFVSALSAVRER